MVGALLVLVVAGGVVAGMLQGFFPGYAQMLSNSFWYLLIGAVVVPILAHPGRVTLVGVDDRAREVVRERGCLAAVDPERVQGYGRMRRGCGNVGIQGGQAHRAGTGDDEDGDGVGEGCGE